MEPVFILGSVCSLRNEVIIMGNSVGILYHQGGKHWNAVFYALLCHFNQVRFQEKGAGIHSPADTSGPVAPNR